MTAVVVVVAAAGTYLVLRAIRDWHNRNGWHQ